jgi:hypothetical protein
VAVSVGVAIGQEGWLQANPAFLPNRMNDAAFQIAFSCRHLLHLVDTTSEPCPGCNRRVLDRFDSTCAIELSGCLGPKAQGLFKVMAEIGGEGPEGLKSRYDESLSIGFQVNRALRIEHMMESRLYGSGRGEKSRLGKELSQEAGVQF